MSFYANTTDEVIVKNVAKGLGLTKNSNNRWELQGMGVTLAMGYQDGASYVLMGESNPTVFKKANSPIDKSLFVDKLMYARLNVQSILKMKLNGEKVGAELKKECKDELGGDLGGAVYKSIENIDYIEMEVVNEGKTMNLSLIMLDKNKTPIEFVLEQLFEML
jgi:hypothetical protein